MHDANGAGLYSFRLTCEDIHSLNEVQVAFDLPNRTAALRRCLEDGRERVRIGNLQGPPLPAKMREEIVRLIREETARSITRHEVLAVARAAKKRKREEAKRGE